MRPPLVFLPIGMRNGLQVWTHEDKIVIQLFDTPERVMEATFTGDEAQKIRDYLTQPRDCDLR